MTLKEIAHELVAGCREGRETENLEKLYAADAVSVEAAAPGEGMDRATHGRDAIRGKHEWWAGAMEVTEGQVSGPFLHGDDRFAVRFSIRGRNKSDGAEWDMEELAVYHVADGKIVREEFFNNM